MDDEEFGSRRSRSSRGTSSTRGAASATTGGSDRPLRKKKSRRESGESSVADGSSPTRKKKKKKKKPQSAEDALEAKMRAKKKKQKEQAGSSSKAEDALEAKIRKKASAASAQAGGGGGARSKRDFLLEEEEKVEEGLSPSYDDDGDDDDDGYYDEEDQQQRGGYNNNERGSRDYNNSSSRGKSSRAGAVAASGVPVTREDPNEGALFTTGGGDVRNKPRNQLSQSAQQLDPLREAELEKERNKKNVNQRYADLHETGQWGGLTKWEKCLLCLLTVGAVVAAIVLGLKLGRSEKTPEPTNQPTASPTGSPSATPTMAPTGEEYRERTGLDLMLLASPKLTLPLEPSALIGASTRQDSTPQQLAAEFVMYDDPLQIPARDPRFMERYALAVFYYSNGGCAGDWINSDNWLDDEEHCERWHGIVCDLKKRVSSIDLSKNYLTGKIPIELGQLMELSNLDLSNNALTGNVPSEAMSMGGLFTIQLNNNLLVGEFPFEEVKTGAAILDNLWIQENTDLTGSITESYCKMNSITLDCDNFNPQPTYTGDTGLTTFQLTCLSEVATMPKEYTCNFDAPEPFVKPPLAEGETPAPTPAVCGTPPPGT